MDHSRSLGVTACRGSPLLQHLLHVLSVNGDYVTYLGKR